MAIFNMEDSSINESKQSGKGYRRYSEIKHNESLKFNDKARNLGKKLIKDIDNENKNKRYNKLMKAAFDAQEESLKYDDRNPKNNIHDIRKNFNKNFSGPESLFHKNISSKANDEILNRQKEKREKLKEAAEYILSVLDEMDYIEESEKK